MSILKYHLAGLLLKSADTKNRFRHAFKNAMETKNNAKNVSLTQISIQEDMLVEKLKDLTKKAKAIVCEADDPDTDSIEILRSIFTQLKALKRQLKQHQMSRNLLNHKLLRENNDFLNAMRHNQFMELYSREKLSHYSRASSKNLNKKALKLKIDRESNANDTEELDSALEPPEDTEEPTEDDGFTNWLQELVVKRTNNLESLLLHKDVTVEDIEKRLKALRTL